MNNPGTIKLTECYDSSEGVVNIHAPGCRDIARWKNATFDGGVYPASVTAGISVEEAAREMAEEFNSDFASDEGMSAADYIDEFGGYPVHILPCAAKLIGASI